MLSTIGYRVGVQNGAPLSVRRDVLTTVFEGALPPLFDPAYVRKWDHAGTAVRLRTLAYTFVRFAKNLERRQDDRMGVAIAESSRTSNSCGCKSTSAGGSPMLTLWLIKRRALMGLRDFR
jgi:hypothetical protein